MATKSDSPPTLLQSVQDCDKLFVNFPYNDKLNLTQYHEKFRELFPLFGVSYVEEEWKADNQPITGSVTAKAQACVRKAAVMSAFQKLKSALTELQSGLSSDEELQKAVRTLGEPNVSDANSFVNYMIGQIHSNIKNAAI